MKKRSTALAGVAALVLLASACSKPEANANTSGGLSGDPITIGVQSLDTGAVAYPQSTYGAKAAEWYVNNKMGGINGHPLKIDVCSGDGTPETGVSCANHFVSSNAPVVFDAYDGTSIGAMVPILSEAHIPIVGTLAGQGVAEAAPYGTAFYFSGPLETSALGMVTALHDDGAKSAALAVTDAPSSHGYVDKLVAPLGKVLGVDVTAVYTTADNMNFQVLAQTELASNPDVAGLIALPEDGCTGLIEALKQGGFDGTLFAGSCSQFIDELGGKAEGTIVQPRLWVPLSYDNAPKGIQEQLDAFADAMKQVGYEDQQSARSLYSFAGIINLAKILSDMKGEITNTAVTQAMEAVKDFQTYLGPKVTCDGQQWPDRPGACSHEAIFFKVTKDGTLTPVNDGGFIDLDTSVAQQAISG
ncbi:ABC transporter substrate-binding protein [Petropleomorpha daqingensis]|uniref:Branched-chain amino acid transport system substrate-binding protein n=1 Tax=Petropleomorpha daqingensis TaxID=2026353 RepID=A0A853CMM9_9ACTN|nr:ABC transporter substrate-binding protein [Petropleomorpha daqingensis]NYJ08696.1 branched-chain amino acid transport system substrate-binding protein [Petropleomorpha daqingensis]